MQCRVIGNGGHGEVQECLGLADVPADAHAVHEPEGGVREIGEGNVVVGGGREEGEEVEVGLGLWVATVGGRFELLQIALLLRGLVQVQVGELELEVLVDLGDLFEFVTREDGQEVVVGERGERGFVGGGGW